MPSVIETPTTPVTRERPVRAVTACGVAMLTAFAVLAWESHRALTLSVYLAVMAIAWIALLWAWRSAGRVPAMHLLPVLWGVAIALRVIGFLGAPVFEDDWYRYLWDGRQLVTTGNPYDIAPSAHFTNESVPDAFQTVLSNINHPDVPTIYGPLCQFVFALGYWVAPAQLWPLKVILIAADLVALWLLLRMAAPRHALLYAWCPLLIQETAFTAHPEILGVVFLVAALWARHTRRPALGAILAACAVAARIHALLLVPFLLWPLRWRTGAAFVAALAALYLPFWSQGSAADLAGLKAFLGEWEFNSSLFALVKSITGWNTARLTCNSAFIVVFAALFWRWARDQKSSPPTEWTRRWPLFAQLALGAFFLLSSVVNPWYLLWLAPLVALRPSPMAVAALIAVSLSYIHGGTVEGAGLAPYEHPKWLRPLEYGFILAAAAYAGQRQLFSAEHKTD